MIDLVHKVASCATSGCLIWFAFSLGVTLIAGVYLLATGQL